MRAFFAPAHAWVHVLLQIHDLHGHSEVDLLMGDYKELFSCFMARFNGLPLPPYCPISRIDTAAIQDTAFHAAAPLQATRRRLGPSDADLTDITMEHVCRSLLEILVEPHSSGHSDDAPTASGGDLSDIYGNAISEVSND